MSPGATLLHDSVITCQKPDKDVVCVGGSPDDTANKHFKRLMKEMRNIYPTLGEENIVVSYKGTNVGEEDDFGGVFPLVTLQLVGVRHEMIVGHLIGIDYIEFPAFTTTVLGPGNFVNVAEQEKKKGKLGSPRLNLYLTGDRSNVRL